MFSEERAAVLRGHGEVGTDDAAVRAGERLLVGPPSPCQAVEETRDDLTSMADINDAGRVRTPASSLYATRGRSGEAWSWFVTGAIYARGVPPGHGSGSVTGRPILFMALWYSATPGSCWVAADQITVVQVRVSQLPPNVR